ncbi:MAG: hypothetical protein GF334_05955, partial [Candidatus Altiarchaeales archaeon]|nr:hypothetical protein [Candidatus Altiarchaeales archaeon]
MPSDEKEFQEAIARNKHLKAYLDRKDIERPEFHIQLDRNMKDMEYPNLIYPVGDPIFIHVWRKPGEDNARYIPIEPKLSEREQEIFDELSEQLIKLAHAADVSDRSKELADLLTELMNQLVSVKGVHLKQTAAAEKKGFLENLMSSLQSKKIKMSPQEYEKIRYFLIRDRVGYGILEPLLRDPYIEDIHTTGVSRIYIVHKIFEMIATEIIFTSDIQLDKYVFASSERVERPVSEAEPVVDAIMPDGSRVNFIYGREVSLEGSSFTIRKFSKVPISISQIVNWKTMSSELAAYLWLCLENGMNMFVCGETASGKTTTLNAASTFIKPTAKVYSVENTPEVTMPHPAWQHLVTRESGKETDVSMMDLLLAALRSRPDYIIVGEIRGAEGNIAFQAMQTGHPVLSTFHAGSPHQMIQRMTGNPINVPLPAIDNLNLVLIQQAVYIKGKFQRRVLSLTELVKFYEELQRVGTAQVFTWHPAEDKHVFDGYLNSYLLEEKIAKILGYVDTREIYPEVLKRAKIIDKMIEEKIFNYFDVWEITSGYYNKGDSGLPFA